MLRLASTILLVLVVFIALMALHQWYVDNQDRYAIVRDSLTIFRIIIGVQFAVGTKIMFDAVKRALGSIIRSGLSQ